MLYTIINHKSKKILTELQTENKSLKEKLEKQFVIKLLRDDIIKNMDRYKDKNKSLQDFDPNSISDLKIVNFLTSVLFQPVNNNEKDFVTKACIMVRIGLHHFNRNFDCLQRWLALTPMSPTSVKENINRFQKCGLTFSYSHGRVMRGLEIEKITKKLPALPLSPLFLLFSLKIEILTWTSAQLLPFLLPKLKF